MKSLFLLMAKGHDTPLCRISLDQINASALNAAFATCCPALRFVDYPASSTLARSKSFETPWLPESDSDFSSTSRTSVELSTTENLPDTASSPQTIYFDPES